MAERKRAAPCIGWAELEEASPYQRKPLRASLASVFQLAVVMLVVARFPSFSHFGKIESYDDLVERVRYIGVKD